MAGSLRAVVGSIDPQLPLTQVESMDQIVAEARLRAASTPSSSPALPLPPCCSLWLAFTA
jgi:hypothetical protein